jgi:hypothetical protein
MSRLVAVVLPSEEQQTGDMIAVKATKQYAMIRYMQEQKTQVP